MTGWYSLYLHSAEADTLTAALQTDLTTQGYTLYDPFGLMPGGKAYPNTIKLFIAPPQNDWMRVLCAEPLPKVFLSEWGERYGGVWAALEGGISQVQAFHLDTSPALHQALSLSDADTQTRGNTSAIPLQALGGDVRSMAEGVNVNQAQGMFDKIAGRLLKGDEHSAARDLLNAGVNWSSAGGRKIQAVLASLPIPQWREPDFVALRDAYQLHKRRQRNPNATLYPGDSEAMAVVPDALAYTPIFAGKAG